MERLRVLVEELSILCGAESPEVSFEHDLEIPNYPHGVAYAELRSRNGKSWGTHAYVKSSDNPDQELLRAKERALQELLEVLLKSLPARGLRFSA